MLEILDAMIATVTVVLVLSLIVQSVQQIFKQLFNMKSKFMERELFAMLVRVPYKRSVVPVKMQYKRLLEKHPEVKEILGEISGRLNSIGYDDLSMIESLKKEEFFKLIADIVDTGELEAAHQSKLHAGDRNTLVEKINFLQRVRWDVERWYDVTIKSFQDHYERRMKMWAFILSALVVIWLNANLFEIYQEFSSNKVLRETVVKLAERFASTPRESLLVVTPSRGSAESNRLSDSVAFAAMRAHISRIDSLVNTQSFSIMRWNSPTGTPIGWDASVILKGIGRNFFGWLGMILLVGLGAPFWYDLLKTLVGVKDRLRGRAGGGETKEGETSELSRTAGPPVRNEPPAIG